MPEQVKVEKWMEDAAREIRTLKPNYTDACDYAEVIARHYVAREREEWIPCEVRKPVQYASALITHTDTRDGSPTVEEAQWNGEQWCLTRSNPHDEPIFLDAQVLAWREIPAPFTAQGDGQ